MLSDSNKEDIALHLKKTIYETFVENISMKL